MKLNHFLSLIIGLLTVFGSIAQKKVVDHNAYNDWKKNENQIVSNNGRYISYEINPHRGDGYLYFYDKNTSKLDSFPRGKEAVLASTNEYLAFKIVPGFDTLRNCELKKVDKKKWPKDTLAIYIFEKDTLIKIPMLKAFSVGEEHKWLSYTIDDNELKPAKTEGKSSKKKGRKKKGLEKTEYKSDGKVLTVCDPISDKKYQFKDVTDYKISENGNVLVFVEHKKEKVDSFQIQMLSLLNEEKLTVQSKYTSVKSINIDKEANQFAYLATTDTTKNKIYSLNLYDFSTKSLSIVTDSNSVFIPTGKSPSENRQLTFTNDGRFLFFGIADRPIKEEKDTLLESEKVEVDIWNYKESRLQSQQIVELKTDLKKSDIYCLDRFNGNVMQITNDTLKSRVNKDLKGEYLFAYSDEKYAIQNQWEVPNREDHYRISLLDGSVQPIKTAVGFNGEMSPKGKWYSYFDEKNSNYFVRNLSSGEEKCMTCEAKNIEWQEDVNGMPMVAGPLGTLGYSANEDKLYIQSKFDVWVYDLNSSALSCLTNHEGKSRNIRLELRKWNEDSLYIDYENVYLQGFNESDKSMSLFEIVDHTDHLDVKQLYQSNHKYILLKRSKDKQSVILRKSSISDYPEVRLLDSEFNNEKIISNTNPQQGEYNWVSAELVSWKAYDGTKLEGLVFKPENYDPTKKYPLLIYYYELNSDQLYSHYVPKPTASIIYPTEYASAGYIIFIPDIRYKIGHPAQSAYNCIMSGTDYLLKTMPSIDSTKMGLQGQSWGGYQTAQLITMTNRYSAAMAGAPVANMFSAYGGIRWGSGVNRQFQYERTQSRIGKTIWDAPELYIENSPLFHIPKIQTPLLIMANDKDGAVPWYQGIEMFTGMKRLGKPCWMLNYNGDDHNLMENANRMDLSIRMRQFFDHYLMDKPAPTWMTEGIPAVEKGKKLGY